MFDFSYRPRFRRKYQKLIQQNPALEAVIDEVLVRLAQNPRDPVLRSHKVRDRDGLPAFSVEVTGDLRITWDYGARPNLIDLLDIGGHSGGKKVYR